MVLGPQGYHRSVSDTRRIKGECAQDDRSLARLGSPQSLHKLMLPSESDWPNLSDYMVTSPVSEEYNCFAWSLEEDDRRWDPHEDYYWPPNIERELSIKTIIQIYEAFGYETCNTGTLEAGYEKIAIYADSTGELTHVARQLLNGRWTSKLGRFEDIEHGSVDDLTGPLYGQVVMYMRRIRGTAD